MKTLFVLTAFCIVSIFADNDIKKDHPLMSPKVKTFWQECLMENGLEEGVLKEMQKDDKNMHAVGCVVGCMFEKFELVNEDGSVNREKLKSSAKEMLTNMGRDYDEYIERILMDCSDLAEMNTDKCLKFLMLSKCSSQRYLEYVQKTRK